MLQRFIVLVVLISVCGATYFPVCNILQCGPYGRCRAGRCVCRPNYTLKNGRCVGGCRGGPCQGGKICKFGKCVCPAGEVEVDGKCVDRCTLCGDNGSCKRGRCICDDGYVLRNYVCIDPCIFTTCLQGRICKFGKCLCPKGEIEVDNKCVEKCPPRKEFKSCSTACPINCENYKNPPQQCTKNCRPDVKCVCKEGYIELSSTDFRCVRPSKCPDPCSGVDCGRNGKCKNGKCVCRQGYQYKGKCVRICPFPKVFNPCPTACPLTCLNYLNPPDICTANCRPGVQCVCPRGLVERSDSDSTCVPKRSCPRIYY